MQAFRNLGCMSEHTIFGRACCRDRHWHSASEWAVTWNLSSIKLPSCYIVSKWVGFSSDALFYKGTLSLFIVERVVYVFDQVIPFPLEISKSATVSHRVDLLCSPSESNKSVKTESPSRVRRWPNPTANAEAARVERPNGRNVHRALRWAQTVGWNKLFHQIRSTFCLLFVFSSSGLFSLIAVFAKGERVWTWVFRGTGTIDSQGADNILTMFEQWTNNVISTVFPGCSSSNNFRTLVFRKTRLRTMFK